MSSVTASDLAYLSIRKLGDAYRNKALSPVEVTKTILGRIDRMNPHLNAFLRVTHDEALRDAKQAEEEIGQGKWRGPLHGIPVSVKDLFFTAGIETTGGSPIYRGFKPALDSTVVACLKAAGAIILGKNNLHELAYGVTNENPHYGACLNPWDTKRIPGGSSGGSAAAVAAGLSFASYGTDTGGSIRIPASYCGVSGLKPTYGRISRHGVLPLSTNLDHVGPFARSVEDIALAAEAIAGPDQKDPSCLSTPCPHWHDRLSGLIRGWRIGLVRGSFIGRLHSEVADGVERTMRDLQILGVEIEEIEIPDAEEVGEVSHLLQMADGAALYHRLIKEQPASFNEDVRILIEQGHLVSAVDYINAQRLRRHFQEQLHSLFDRFKAFVLPATPVPAPNLGQRSIEWEDGQEDAGLAATRLSRPFNFAGVPVLTLPCGLTSTGLPFAMQIVSRSGDELSGLRLGHAYQKQTQWHTLRPKI